MPTVPAAAPAAPAINPMALPRDITTPSKNLMSALAKVQAMKAANEPPAAPAQVAPVQAVQATDDPLYPAYRKAVTTNGNVGSFKAWKQKQGFPADAAALAKPAQQQQRYHQGDLLEAEALAREANWRVTQYPDDTPERRAFLQKHADAANAKLAEIKTALAAPKAASTPAAAAPASPVNDPLQSIADILSGKAQAAPKKITKGQDGQVKTNGYAPVATADMQHVNPDGTYKTPSQIADSLMSERYANRPEHVKPAIRAAIIKSREGRDNLVRDAMAQHPGDVLPLEALRQQLNERTAPDEAQAAIDHFTQQMSPEAATTIRNSFNEETIGKIFKKPKGSGGRRSGSGRPRKTKENKAAEVQTVAAE
jgi:hypothetical protein